MEQVKKTGKETGLQRYHRLQREAKELGIKTSLDAGEIEVAIAAKAAGTSAPVDITTGGLAPEEARKIEARLKFESEVQEKFRVERQAKIDRATIIAESEALKIPINLPENPTELQLAKARQQLGLKKKEIKPSPETVAIEASKRGYYVFNNLEQDDASHTANLGGKYFIHLIADQIHVLSEYHVKKWKQIAVQPVYGRVPVPGPPREGYMGEECKRIGGKSRFLFEYLGEAPSDAPFGMVTDIKVLDELKQPV